MLDPIGRDAPSRMTLFPYLHFHFVQVPNAGLGHVHTSMAATLDLRICPTAYGLLTTNHCLLTTLSHNPDFAEFHESADFFAEADFCKVPLFANDFETRALGERVERLRLVARGTCNIGA